MKFFTNKETTKKIIIAVLLVMTFNFISPVASQADFGGALFSPIAQLIASLGDLVISGLQSWFIGYGDIADKDIPKTEGSARQYYIRYSPGIIFSGTVPGLKVNFINASYNDNEKYKNIETTYLNPDTREEDKPKTYPGDIPDGDKAKYGYNENTAFQFSTRSGEEWYNFWDSSSDHMIATWVNEETGDRYVSIRDFPSDTVKDYVWNATMGFLAPVRVLFRGFNYLATSTDVYLVEEKPVDEVTKTSAALELKGTVATWYKALRAIALVGLLSVLVYIGIRILISSTGQEKAKYKKMIGDWLAAICILFVLQYIMLFITEITQKITDVLSVNIIGSRGEDILMSNLRNTLQELDSADFSSVFSELIMYVVLVIYTVMFTIQYLKRLLYMAFFTMIAPLIALTYPLDKIKDGQAQAFTMWIREYTFNALLQPMHLLLYYMFVSSAMDLVNGNPLYAVVAIGFLLPAEKFFRKMFGFEKASSASQMGAAAGGALVMNAINKIGQRSGKQAAGKGGSGGSGDSGSGGSTPRYVSGEKGTPMDTSGAGSGKPPKPPKDKNGNPIGTAGSAFGGNVAAANSAPKVGVKRKLSGIGNVSGHYLNRGNRNKLLKGAGRGIRKGLVGAAGAATLGTIGLAAGIATGDPSKALQYGAAGATAGYMGANNLGDKATEFEKSNRELYKEGKWGTDEYNTRNSIKELTNDHDFNKVCKQLGVKGQNGREALIRQFHSNGITKSEDIKKAMTAGASTNNNNRDQLIAAAKIKKEANQYGMKKKDIREKLMKDMGVTNSNDPMVKKAIELIDLM